MERSGIKHRVSQADSLEPSKVQKSAVKGQLEDQGWVKRKERDHASVRCQASSVGFKPGQVRELHSLIYQTLKGGNPAFSTLYAMQKPMTGFPRGSTPRIWISLLLSLSHLKQRKDPKNFLLYTNISQMSISYLSHIFKSQLSLEVLLSHQFDKS